MSRTGGVVGRISCQLVRCHSSICSQNLPIYGSMSRGCASAEIVVCRQRSPSRCNRRALRLKVEHLHTMRSRGFCQYSVIGDKGHPTPNARLCDNGVGWVISMLPDPAHLIKYVLALLSQHFNDGENGNRRIPRFRKVSRQDRQGGKRRFVAQAQRFRHLGRLGDPLNNWDGEPGA
jgi:hypothetical protein